MGLESYMIDVELNITNGKFILDIVGLPDAAVSEARDRIIAAINNSGLIMNLSSHFTFNLAPAKIIKRMFNYKKRNRKQKNINCKPIKQQRITNNIHNYCFLKYLPIFVNYR